MTTNFSNPVHQCISNVIYSHLRLIELRYISRYHLSTLKEAIIKDGPVLAIMNAKLSLMTHYESGIYKEFDYTNPDHLANHAVLVYGYRETSTYHIYSIKNTWSTSWGMNGYAYIQDSQSWSNIGDNIAILIVRPKN